MLFGGPGDGRELGDAVDGAPVDASQHGGQIIAHGHQFRKLRYIRFREIMLSGQLLNRGIPFQASPNITAAPVIAKQTFAPFGGHRLSNACSMMLAAPSSPLVSAMICWK